MGFEYANIEDVEWVTSEQKPGIDGGDNPPVRFKPLFGGKSLPARVQLCEYDPGHFEPAHSHDRSEVLYVLRGSLNINDMEIKAGSAIFVEAGTTYGPLTGGDEGILFVRVDFTT